MIGWNIENAKSVDLKSIQYNLLQKFDNTDSTVENSGYLLVGMGQWGWDNEAFCRWNLG